MLIALRADVHSNLEALSARLAHANEGGSERYAFPGDLVGHGAGPQGVVDIAARYAAQGARQRRG